MRQVKASRIEVIDDEMAAVLRAMTPAQRLASAHGMWRYAHDRTVALIRREHPEWDDARVKSELRRRMLGSD
jgi:hypothetical protein